MTRRILYLCAALASLCIFPGLTPALQAAETVTREETKALELGSRLSKAFRDMGSFHARYIVGKYELDLRMSVILTHDTKNRYYTFELFDENDKAVGLLLIDYRSSPVFMQINPAKRTAVRASFDALLERRLHLFGALHKAIQEAEARNGRAPLPIDTGAFVPAVDLRFTSDMTVNTAPAMTMNGMVSASWLEPGNFLGAETISENREYTIVRHSPSHVVVLDNDSGFISEEAWFDADRTNMRRLLLNELKKISSPQPLEEHIPYYRQLAIEDAAVDVLMDAMSPYFLSGMAEALVKKGELDAVLGTWSGDLKRRTREIARDEWKKFFVAGVDAGQKLPGAREVTQSYLLPEFRKQKGAAGGELPFRSFLLATADADGFRKAASEWFGEALDPKRTRDTYTNGMKGLPEDRRLVLTRLLDAFLGDYLDAKLLGYMDGVRHYAELNAAY